MLFRAVLYGVHPVLLSARAAARRFVAGRWSKHGANMPPVDDGRFAMVPAIRAMWRSPA
jgi:hypothetical protein